MKQNLRFTIFAFAVVAGGAALSGFGLGGPIGSARAQTAAAPMQAKPCDPAAPGASDPGGCNTNGVIHPPATGDQGGVISPPSASKAMPMPVIPPPGSPGGNADVQPK